MTNNVMDRGENTVRACPRPIATFNFPRKFCPISFPPKPCKCYVIWKYCLLLFNQMSCFKK